MWYTYNLYNIVQQVYFNLEKKKNYSVWVYRTWVPRVSFLHLPVLCTSLSTSPLPHGDRGAASSPRFMTSHTNPMEKKAHLSYSLSGHHEIASHCLQGGRITPTTRKMCCAYWLSSDSHAHPHSPLQDTTRLSHPSHHVALCVTAKPWGSKAPYRNLW